VKVKDLIEHLTALPQDLPVMKLWDEGGTYHPRVDVPAIKEIVKSNSSLSYDTEWVDEIEGDIVTERRRVVVV